ncbi:MAG: hypothetical protein R3E12_01445 [Candidatus Eisenbacteria bacterium]
MLMPRGSDPPAEPGPPSPIRFAKTSARRSRAQVLYSYSRATAGREAAADKKRAATEARGVPVTEPAAEPVPDPIAVRAAEV